MVKRGAVAVAVPCVVLVPARMVTVLVPPKTLARVALTLEAS